MVTEVAAIGRVPSDKKGRYRTKVATGKVLLKCPLMRAEGHLCRHFSLTVLQ